MQPKCCDDCPKSKETRLCRYDSCYKWRAWFREEWESIRRAAELYKTEKEKPKK